MAVTKSTDPIDILLEMGIDLDNLSEEEDYLSALKEAIAKIQFQTKGAGDERQRILQEEVIKVRKSRKAADPKFKAKTTKVSPDAFFNRKEPEAQPQPVPGQKALPGKGPSAVVKRQTIKPELFKKAYKFLNSTSYINFKLTGNYVIDHFSAANTSPFYDITNNTWSDKLVNNLIDLNQLPELVWSDQIIGTITSQSAKATGLKEGTPVTAGTIDAAAEAISVGVNQPGDMMMMYGSTKFFISINSKSIFDERLWYAPWLFKNESCSLAGLATSGTLTHWFKKEFARELQGDDIFIQLAKEAEKSPAGSNGVIFLPYFSGERTPIHDTHAKGSFFGLNLTNNRADLYRSIFEGIAYGTKHVFDTFADLNNLPKKLYSVGGGTNNKLWSQVTTDIIELEQIIRKKTIGASYGDAFIGALALGDVDRNDINSWNEVDYKIIPKKNPVYEKGYQHFRNLYENTKHLMREMDN